MGRFSYECTKCGWHDQFDYIDECVVKLGDSTYVEGTYNEYGQVIVAVVKDGMDTKSFTKKRGIRLADEEGDGKGTREIEVQLEQFRHHFPHWMLKGDELVATDIYCAGDEDAAKKGKKMPMKDGPALFLMAMLSGRAPDEFDDRYCVPKGITAKPFLFESELAGLPKIGAMSGKDDNNKKRKADTGGDEGAEKKPAATGKTSA